MALRHWLRGIPVVFAENSYPADYPWIEDHCTVLNMPRLAPLTAIAQEFHGAADCHGYDARPASIGYLGVVDADHGSLIVLDALGLLAAEGLDVALDYVGPIRPKHARQIEQRAEQLGLSNVRLHGYVPPPEAWRRIAGCRAAVAMLAPKANLVDSYPTKLFEYMALGLPIVASDVPLYCEVVERSGCGYCVAPDDPSAVAERLRRLLTRPDECLALGCCGQQAVHCHYRWEIEAAKLLDLYARLLQQSGATSVSPVPIQNTGPIVEPNTDSPKRRAA